MRVMEGVGMPYDIYAQEMGMGRLGGFRNLGLWRNFEVGGCANGIVGFRARSSR